MSFVLSGTCMAFKKAEIDFCSLLAVCGRRASYYRVCAASCIHVYILIGCLRDRMDLSAPGRDHDLFRYVFRERKNTLVYVIRAEGKNILLLGSMALDEKTEYPQGTDLLILPYQGKRRPEKAACEIVEKLKPKRILLDHFDDAFPPASREEDTRPFYRMLSSRFPQIQAVKPKAGKPVRL